MLLLFQLAPRLTLIYGMYPSAICLSSLHCIDRSFTSNENDYTPTLQLVPKRERVQAQIMILSNRNVSSESMDIRTYVQSVIWSRLRGRLLCLECCTGGKRRGGARIEVEEQQRIQDFDEEARSVMRAHLDKREEEVKPYLSNAMV